MGDEDSSVRVGVRIRPQIPREIIDMCRICTTVTPGEPQVVLGSDKSFTYDYVFDTPAQQEEIYEACVSNLINGALQGYNATVLAYGQTGSGKTFTMGTGFEYKIPESEKGIIPRAIEHLFRGIKEREDAAKAEEKSPPIFTIVAQFMELYNEDIIDLFEPSREVKMKGAIKIQEDPMGGIVVVGAASRVVNTQEEALGCLRMGSLSRTTASTQMNSESSRSHAIFTLIIKQQRLVSLEPMEGDNAAESTTEFETLSAKFHFVDLAGSERLKRTGATGDRAKEGIAINCGLLALGNVISALGDKSKKVSHVPYRDSKLTRLLQDSLGGNSQTLMIACISPSDQDFMETLNTLKYANRARNIKNRVTVNQDSSSKMIIQLRQQIAQLEFELLEYRQGKRMINEFGQESENDQFHENKMLQSELRNKQTRLKAMQDTIDTLTERNAQLRADITTSQLGESGGNPEVADIIKEYLGEIEDLRAKLLESEKTCEILRKREMRPNPTSPRHIMMSPGTFEMESPGILEVAKKDILKDKELLKSLEAQAEEKQRNGEDSEHSDSEESESDTESEEKEQEQQAYQLELANLTTEISIKQKLIEELEMSKQRTEAIKHHYEDKLEQLHARIKATQAERDKVMATYTGVTNQPTDKVRKIRDDYERKISTMQSEMKKLKAGQKKHEKLMKSQTRYEEQMKRLQSEIGDMKRTKVRLMSQMREETTRHKQAEDKRNREIAQLRKEQLKRDSQIKTLEADKRAKEVVLRRKNEEVLHLRKNMRSGMSRKAAGMLRPRSDTSDKKTFSPKHAKQKWQTLEKTITKIAMNKQAVATLERDMERQLRERETLSRRLEGLRRRLKSSTNPTERDDLEEQIDNMQINIDYVQGGIADSQHSIMMLEEAKDCFDGTEVSTLVSTVRGIDEAHYLIEKLYNMTVNQSYSAAQKVVVQYYYITMDVAMSIGTLCRDDVVFDPGITTTFLQSPQPHSEIHLKEMDSKMLQLKQENATQEQLLSHMVERHEFDIFASDPMFTSATSLADSSDSSDSSRAQSPVPTIYADNCNGNGSRSLVESASSTSIPTGLGAVSHKIRRRTALPEDLLYPGQPAVPADTPPPDQAAPTFRLPLVRVPSLPDTLKFSSLLPRPDSLKSSPNLQRKNYDRQDSLSPRPVRRATFNLQPNNLLGKPGSMEQGLDASPPNSPTANRRGIMRDENVFSRLTSSTTSSPSEKTGGKGVISIYHQGGKVSPKAVLTCTHIAKGHSRAVLSVDATDELLFSASKDRSVKVWDLTTGVERDCLRGHPNNVIKVKYLPESRLIFSMSSYYVKVFDIRDCSKCIKILCSSGLTSTSPMTMSQSLPSRTLELPNGETQLNDMATNHSESLLYTAAADRVRVWDLKRLECTGKLSGGHQAAVMCLAVGRISDEVDVVVTGSKDHYIKVFEVNRNSDAAVFTPKMNLTPPHYDGIQSLAIRGDILFSGSRDMCIKKWDLDKQEPVLSLNNAHKDWVTVLKFMPGGQMLLSGCRGGILKLWSTEGVCTSPLGEIKAHNDPINAISTNSSRIFTASNDGTIRLWRPHSRYDINDTSWSGV